MKHVDNKVVFIGAIIALIFSVSLSGCTDQDSLDKSSQLSFSGWKLLQGNNKIGEDNFDEALTSFKEAIKLDPNNQYAWIGIGSVMQVSRILGIQYSKEEMLYAFDQATKIKSEDNNLTSFAWAAKGEIFSSLGHDKEAADAYNQAIVGYPDTIGASYAKFRKESPPLADEANDNPLTAVTIMEQRFQFWDVFQALNPSGALEYFSELGLAYQEKEDYEKALESFDNYLDINAKNPYIWFDKGQCLSNLKLYDQSIDAFDKSIELKPDFSSAWASKAGSLYRIDKKDEAFIAISKARELDPKDETISQIYSQIKSELGES